MVAPHFSSVHLFTHPSAHPLPIATYSLVSCIVMGGWCLLLWKTMQSLFTYVTIGVLKSPLTPQVDRLPVKHGDTRRVAPTQHFNFILHSCLTYLIKRLNIFFIYGGKKLWNNDKILTSAKLYKMVYALVLLTHSFSPLPPLTLFAIPTGKTDVVWKKWARDF